MTSGDEEKIRRFSSLERSPEKVNLGGRKVNLKSLSPLSTVILQLRAVTGEGELGRPKGESQVSLSFIDCDLADPGLASRRILRPELADGEETCTFKVLPYQKGPFGLGDFVIEFAYGFAFDSRTEEASEWDQCSYAPDA
ncbi:unnamed protein product [Linum tenue]|uniref:Uncharacterized protein n=1 Tax=Linum tenue TaxID=586396 RepID=A0AAV0I8V6_9ROSI|nr:unnamed protein product [Linum tenue]